MEGVDLVEDVGVVDFVIYCPADFGKLNYRQSSGIIDHLRSSDLVDLTCGPDEFVRSFSKLMRLDWTIIGDT